LPSDYLLILITLFGISLVTNATPFLGASYTLLATAELISMGYSPANFALIVIITGAGATFAKIVLYSGALGLRRELARNKNVRLFHEWLHKRSFYVTLFITAIIPALPLDDYIYIGAGANRARLGPMVGVTFLAKLAKSAVEIFLEFNGILGLSSFTRRIFGFSWLEFSLLTALLFVVLGVVIYKLDWESLLRRARLIKNPGQLEGEKDRARQT
jgi:arginine exporter protein ArgO